jgi:hypothetical protein
MDTVCIVVARVSLLRKTTQPLFYYSSVKDCRVSEYRVPVRVANRRLAINQHGGWNVCLTHAGRFVGDLVTWL